MADDEVLFEIEKCFWPKGVMRGLTPVLRSLGDKHGNLVIAAQAAKGVIMMKGSKEAIEAAKPGLKVIIEEHFPDAPLPEQYAPPAKPAAPNETEKTKPAAATVAPAAQAPAKAPVKAPTKPVAKDFKEPAKSAKAAPVKGMLGRFFAGKAAASAPAAAAPSAMVRGRRRPPPALAAPPDLLWHCLRKSSSFARKPLRFLSRRFSAEPQNLMGLHSQKYSGLANFEALDVHAVKAGEKESIELVQSHPKPSRHRRPKSISLVSGLSKCPKRGLSRLETEVGSKFYRRGLLGVARVKYMKVQQSFRKKRAAVKSRRARV